MGDAEDASLDPYGGGLGAGLAIDLQRGSSMLRAVHVINSLADEVGASGKARVEATEIFRMVLETRLLRGGRSVAALAAASLLLALKSMSMRVGVNEAARALKIPRRYIAKAYRLLLKNLDIRVALNTPEHHLPKIITALNLPRAVFEGARRVRFIFGKNPRCVAAGAVYVACRDLDLKVSLRRAAVAADASPTSVKYMSIKLTEFTGA